jgi:hypothetical protein
MNSKKITIYVLVLLLSIGGINLIHKVIKASKIMAYAKANKQYLHDAKINSDDSILFKSNELKYLNPNLVINSTYRNEIRCFNYRSICDIYYTKIDLSKDILMNQFIRFRERFTNITTMHVYDDLSKNSVYDFKILGEKVAVVDSVIFSFTGDGNKLKRFCYNKNFISYYLPVSSFSLRYGTDAPTDIYFGTPTEIFGFFRREYPLMFAFYKRHKSLYVVLVISDKGTMHLDADFLETIMNDNSNPD